MTDFLLFIREGGDDKGCPRCGGAVFLAEQVLSKGVTFHKKCLSCASCRKALDLSSYFAGHGKDSEIYCKVWTRKNLLLIKTVLKNSQIEIGSVEDIRKVGWEPGLFF